MSSLMFLPGWPRSTINFCKASRSHGHAQRGESSTMLRASL